MSEDRVTSPKWARGAKGLGVVVALSVGAAGCGGSIGSTASKAAFVARMAAAAVSHAAEGSNPTAPAGTTVPGVAPATSPTAPTAATPPAGALTAAAKVAAAATTGTNRTAQTAAPATAGGAKSAASTSTASPSTSPPPIGAGATPAAARRQPTGAEVAQAIKAVHNLVPFFTPTAADVADVGNQVCSAFDHGQTFAQVKAKALDMVGAGAFSFLIPSSVPGQAVRTVVALYCPGYTSKLG